MPQQFILYSSRYLTWCLIFAHMVTIGALLCVNLPIVEQVLLIVVLLGSMIYYLLRDAFLRLDHSYVAIKLDASQVVLVNRKGEELSGEVQKSSIVTPHVVLLNIRIPKQRWHSNVIILSDSMDAESFRQLRVSLKWGC